MPGVIPRRRRVTETGYPFTAVQKGYIPVVLKKTAAGEQVICDSAVSNLWVSFQKAQDLLALCTVWGEPLRCDRIAGARH